MTKYRKKKIVKDVEAVDSVVGKDSIFTVESIIPSISSEIKEIRQKIVSLVNDRSIPKIVLESNIPLYMYRVRHSKHRSFVPEGADIVDDYYVEAPSMCSATRNTLAREEVHEILSVHQWLSKAPKPITFRTYEECK